MEDPQVRKLLLRYASDDRSKRRTGNLRDLSNSEKTGMFEYFKEVSPSFYSLLVEIEENPTVMRPVFQKLLLCLSSPSPVCSLIPATEDIGTLLANICKEVEIQQDPTLWNTLHNQLPIFFELFQALPSCYPLIRPLLKELWTIAVDPFSDALAQTKQLAPPKNTEMSFFPHLPALQSRGKYVADKSSEKRAKINQRCQKKYRGHPTLLPGVFTVFCPHGKYTYKFALAFQYAVYFTNILLSGLNFFICIFEESCSNITQWGGGSDYRFPRRLSVRLSVCLSVSPSVHSVSIHSVFRTFLSCLLRY